MQVEWAKAHACYLHWSKEVILLVEESRHVITYLDWKANWWLDQAHQCPNAHNDIQNGQEAYLHCQSMLMQDLAKLFASLWHPILLSANLLINWPKEYIHFGQHNPRVLCTYGGCKKEAAKVACEAQKTPESGFDKEDIDEDEESDGLSEDDMDVSPYC